jgi:hypothetical protein
MSEINSLAIRSLVGVGCWALGADVPEPIRPDEFFFSALVKLFFARGDAP